MSVGWQMGVEQQGEKETLFCYEATGVNVMQKLSWTEALQKGMISYLQTGQFSPSKAVIKSRTQLPVLNVNRPLFVLQLLQLCSYVLSWLAQWCWQNIIVEHKFRMCHFLIMIGTPTFLTGRLLFFSHSNQITVCYLDEVIIVSTQIFYS